MITIGRHYYSSYARAFMILGCTAGFLALSCPSYASDTLHPIEKKYIEAETSQDPAKALNLWNTLLRSPDLQRLSDQGLTGDTIRKNIVHDYLVLFQKNRRLSDLSKARKFIATKMELSDQIWSSLYLLNGIAETVKNTPDFAKFENIMRDIATDIPVMADKIQDPTEKSHAYYTLSMILTMTTEKQAVFSTDLLSMVMPIVDKLKNDDHRRHIIQRFSKITKHSDVAYNSHYTDIFKAFQKHKHVNTKTLLEIHKNAIQKDQLHVAVDALLLIEDNKAQSKALKSFFYDLYNKKLISEARYVAEKTNSPSRVVDMWSKLGYYYTTHQYPKQGADAFQKAYTHAKKVKIDSSRQKALTLIKNREDEAEKKLKNLSQNLSDADQKIQNSSYDSFEKGDIYDAFKNGQSIKNRPLRVRTFRHMAEQQMQSIDQYGFLNTHDTADKEVTYRLRTISPEITDDSISKQTIEDRIESMMDDNHNGMIATKLSPSSIGNIITHDTHFKPSLTYTPRTIRNMLTPLDHAEVEINYYENDVFNSLFSVVFGNSGFTHQQQTSAPVIIIVENGTTDLPTLYHSLKNLGYDDYLTREGNVYTLHRPLAIARTGTLIINGDQVKSLRLSQESGAYIVNSGRFFVSDTEITSWNISKNEAPYMSKDKIKDFRPFITSWSGSETYIGGSHLNALGYAFKKSYGLTFSSGPNEWLKHGYANDETERPTGIMVGNTIRNAYFGFYSYEANDFSIIGNEYIDSVIYGIDPHDRSRRLVIAYNTIYDTQKKHGIIISREVNDSIITGNIIFENKGTGIMLDRDSNGTVVYANTSFHNKGDGITSFESDCEIIASNAIFENKGAGIRIRNSQDNGLFYNVINDNKGDAIVLYKTVLKGDGHDNRDLELDPYDEMTTVTAVGNIMSNNESGINASIITALSMKQNKFIHQSPKTITGQWFEGDPNLLFRYNQDQSGMMMQQSCPDLAKPFRPHVCKFRRNKTLFMDGQDHLNDRMAKSHCVQNQEDSKNNNKHKGDVH